MVRVGRFGPYLQRTSRAPPRASRPTAPPRRATAAGDRVSLPNGIAPDELTPEKVTELFLGGGGEREIGEHPETGEPVVLKSGRYGPASPPVRRRLAARSRHSPDTLTLADALKVLSLPRALGEDPEGDEIFADPGRYGPYVRRGEDTRSLNDEDQIFTVSLAEAWPCWPSRRPVSAGAAGPAARDGQGPRHRQANGHQGGRFGPYVTDGETNASLRRGQTSEG